MKMPHNLRAKLKEMIPTTILIVCNIFIFIPFYIYKGNVDEYDLSFFDLFQALLIPSVLLSFILIVIGLLLRENAYRRFLSLLFVFALLLWLQGNILVWDYGLLNGESIIWNTLGWRGWIDGAVWALLLVIGYMYRDKIVRVAALASTVLLVLQLVAVTWYSINHTSLWTRQSREVIPPKGIFEFSSSQNVIHIILDGFQSSVFKEILTKDYEHYAGSLDGFVYFDNTLGSFPTTYMSIVAILTGANYQNQIPMAKYKEAALNGKNIVNALHENGYGVDFVPLGPYKPKYYSNSYQIPSLYSDGFSKTYYKIYSAAYLLDLALFREMPHFIKKYIYNDQKWFLKCFVKKKTLPEFQSIADKNFFNDLIQKSEIKRKEPVYKFIHFAITHSPLVMNKQGEYLGGPLPVTLDNFVNQDQFGLDEFIKFINRLKALGIYDSSLIILQADHGAGLPINFTAKTATSEESLKNIAGSATPLLMIKPPYSHARFKTSSAAVALIDIPATISDIMHLPETFPGNSVFKANSESKERKFFSYTWKHENWQSAYFKVLKEYTVSGNVYDESSWRLTNIHSPNPESYRTSQLQFGNDAIAPFLGSGWSGNESIASEGGSFNWAVGHNASIFVSLPNDKPVRLKAEVKSPGYKTPQVVTVKVDGNYVGQWKIRDFGRWLTLDSYIMPSPGRPDISTVEFAFSQFCPPSGATMRPLALMFRSLGFTGADMTELKFGTQEGLSFLRQGWSANEISPSEAMTFNWAIGKSASLELPLLRNRPIELNARVKFMQEKKPQLVTIKADGKEVGRWTVANYGSWENHSVSIPANPAHSRSTNVEFLFSQNVKPKNDNRPLALQFNSIQIK
jgi:Sulfatase